MSGSYFRFPHTPHIAWLGNESPRGDKVLSEEEVERLLSGPVVVEEKLDGANLGFSFEGGGGLRAQNRGAYLTAPYSGQFTRLNEWIAFRQAHLQEALGDKLVFFGEWCAAKHSIAYKRLPDWWLLFDVYDKAVGKFWSVRRRDELALTLGLKVVPRVRLGITSLSDLKMTLLTEESRCGATRMEGLVVRRDCADWLMARGKIVRGDFLQIKDHWRSRALEWNRVDV